ncbi:MAG: MFS transporter, partial [Candidatus Binatia bacterium]
MISRRTIVCLGISQLVCWGVSYNLIGVFGALIATDLRWSLLLVFGGLTVALIVMGMASPVAGEIIDRYGGRYAMSGGSILAAIGCVGIAAITRGTLPLVLF